MITILEKGRYCSVAGHPTTYIGVIHGVNDGRCNYSIHGWFGTYLRSLLKLVTVCSNHHPQ